MFFVLQTCKKCKSFQFYFVTHLDWFFAQLAWSSCIHIFTYFTMDVKIKHFLNLKLAQIWQMDTQIRAKLHLNCPKTCQKLTPDMAKYTPEVYKLCMLILMHAVQVTLKTGLLFGNIYRVLCIFGFLNKKQLSQALHQNVLIYLTPKIFWQTRSRCEMKHLITSAKILHKRIKVFNQRRSTKYFEPKP